MFSNYINSIDIGVIFINLKIIRSFDKISLYLYIHDSFLDLMFFNLKKNRKFFQLRRRLNRKFLYKYKKLEKKISEKKMWMMPFLRRKTVLKYCRKFLFLFLKNKILKTYWNNFKNLLNMHLKRIVSVGFNEIFVMGLSKMDVNANIISEFFFIRLKQYYTIWEVLRNINYLFKTLMHRRKRLVKGYRITCSGRFSRKQRTTYSWKSFGSLALSTMKSKLDYSYRTIALKYSSCTIKVWIRLNRKKRRKVDFVV